MSASYLQYDVQDNPAVLKLHLFVAQGLLDLHVHATIFIKLGGAMVVGPYTGHGTLLASIFRPYLDISASGGFICSAACQMSVCR